MIPLTRRDILKRALIFSAALAGPRFLTAQARPPTAPDGALELFCFGDWGSGDPNDHQLAVARALQEYSRATGITPAAIFLLGDNFYGPMPGGAASPRWQREFEDVYPASAFPGPCYAILGNHDYDDQPGGEKAQLAYAKSRPTRWTMPDRWYRVDLPVHAPIATFLCVNTHFDKLSKADIAAQQRWIDEQLALPRTTPWMIVCGHHPVLSAGTQHGNTACLSPWRKRLPHGRVHAYLCGHEHDLQHLREPDGFTDWLVSGAGGKKLHAVKANAQTHFARSVFGFLHLSIRPRKLTATLVGADAIPLHSFDRDWSA